MLCGQCRQRAYRIHVVVRHHNTAFVQWKRETAAPPRFSPAQRHLRYLNRQIEFTEMIEKKRLRDD